MNHPHVAAADRYAEEVRLGRVPACRWVKLACERYERDRDRSEKRRWAYTFDPDAAERVAKFVTKLPHTKGAWAARGLPIKLEPWQAFILVNAFGFKRSDGTRRFREVFVLVPRKNGKSLVSAGVGLFMFCADGEHGAEVYSGATSEKQAWEVFRPARLMAEKTPALIAKFRIAVTASNLCIHADGSRFEPLIGKPGDGASPSCAIIDEYHEHADSSQLDTMLTGMAARRQPLLWIISTAGDDVSGPCYDKLLTSRQILEGTIEDEEKFYIEYGLDPEDDWTTEEAIRKANPNLDVSADLGFLLARQREAINNAREQNRFKCKHLNLWVQSRAAAFNMEDWNRCYDPTLRIEDFRCHRAWLGTDLASEIDLASIKLMVEDGEGFAAFGKDYLPEATVEDPKNRHYQAWREDGHLVVTPGSMISQRWIEDDIVAYSQIFRNLIVGFDPANASYLADRLETEHGISRFKVPQTAMGMSPGFKRLDALMRDGKLRHNFGPRHPMTWMMSNVVNKPDPNDNWFLRKERPQNKIDGPVALVIATNVMMAGPAVDESPYADGRGLLIV